MLGPASNLIYIESNKDYTNDSEGLIYSIHCLKTNECEVKITPIFGETITFPPYSLIQGAVYHIYIAKMEFDSSKAGFIGYRLAEK